jgi:3-methyladenine DNA glycosylase AlkD
MPDPCIDSRLGNMEQPAYFRSFVKGLVGHPGSFNRWLNRFLFVNRLYFFADDLPDGLQELLWLTGEQHGSRDAVVAKSFFHHLSDLGLQHTLLAKRKEAKYT